jgi:regulator of protease activity HflC (stomatin/prohibitin superfamily)
MNETLLEDILMPYTTLTVSAVLAIVILYNTIKILREYERGVIFLLGRFQKVKGPGLILLIPGIQKMVKVDLRVIVMDVPTQDVISRDNVSVKVNAVIYFRIVDPEKAVIRVENAFEATSQLSQTTLRSVLGQHELDDMLAERDKLNVDIQELLDQRTDNWGIKVANVEIKHVKIINAEAEKQAATMLTEAAGILATEDEALQLRYLQTLKEISNERTNTIVFPMPMEILEPFLKKRSRNI